LIVFIARAARELFEPRRRKYRHVLSPGLAARKGGRVAARKQLCYTVCEQRFAPLRAVVHVGPGLL